MNYELQGKVAIVTGARTGIGQAAAISLARSGAHIVGVGHNEMPETRAQVEAFGVRFLEVLEDFTVLEVKYDAFLPDLVRMAVQAPGRRGAACSKYALCRRFD